MEREDIDRRSFVAKVSGREKRIIAESTLVFGGMTMLLVLLSDASLSRILISGGTDAAVGFVLGAGGVLIARKIRLGRRS